MQTKSSNKVWVVVLALIVIAIVIAVGVVMSINKDSTVKKDQYQAVFLANGQVYFGKISGINNSYIKLTDIYYLQVQQAVQPAASDAADQPQVSLAKLGNELHGPEDEMQINRDQVLFWENLKDDGKVAKAIKDNQQK